MKTMQKNIPQKNNLNQNNIIMIIVFVNNMIILNTGQQNFTKLITAMLI